MCTIASPALPLNKKVKCFLYFTKPTEYLTKLKWPTTNSSPKKCCSGIDHQGTETAAALPAVEKRTIFVECEFMSGLLMNCFCCRAVTSEGSKPDE